MKTFLISPPFGNYISHSRAERVRGSFTYEPRSGLIINTLKSLRTVNGGYVNKIGLRNKGIKKVHFNQDDIFSLVGFNDSDWENIYEYLSQIVVPLSGKLKLELNLGCPNVDEYTISAKILKKFTHMDKFFVGVKLPFRDDYKSLAIMAVDSRVDYLHLSNTLPTSRGGISGSQLKILNLPRVAWASKIFPNTNIVAGGGIYDSLDVVDYYCVGAKHFSLSTIWFNPIKAFITLSDCKYL